MRREEASLAKRLGTLATWQEWSLLIIALGTAIGIRVVLRTNYTQDYSWAMGPWFEQYRAHGFSALAGDFADYNVPFLYLLYLGSLTPFQGLTIVKLIGALFDLVLAAGVAAVAYRVRPNFFLAACGGIAALLLPEVLLNSAMWGQVDSIFTSLLVWTAYLLLIRKPTWAWAFFAAAVMFKLQAAFLLPWMAIAFIVQSHRWRSVAIVVPVILATYIPALLAGRSVESLLSIYGGQVEALKFLTLSAPNIYQWIPNEFYSTVRPAGILFGLATVAFLSILYLRKRHSFDGFSQMWLFRIALVYAVVVPMVLPQMHERYFYPAGVLAFICAIFDRRYLVPAIVLQFTAVMSYSEFLFGQPSSIPLQVVAVIQLATTGVLVWLSIVPPAQIAHPREDASTQVSSARNSS